MIGIVLLSGRALTDFLAVELLILARILIILVMVWLIWAIWRRDYHQIAPTYQVKHWVDAALPFLLSALVLAMLGQSSMPILEAHHPSEEAVGIYAAVQRVAYLPLFALAAITTLAMPKLAVLLEEEDPAAFQKQLGVYLVSSQYFGEIPSKKSLWPSASTLRLSASPLF